MYCYKSACLLVLYIDLFQWVFHYVYQLSQRKAIVRTSQWFIVCVCGGGGGYIVLHTSVCLGTANYDRLIIKRSFEWSYISYNHNNILFMVYYP